MQNKYTEKDIKRFWRKVKRTNDVNECWVWIAYKNPQGYGCFYSNMRTFRAHRVAYEITFGEIQRGLLVCHTCDNPSCVNPSHLFLGSYKDNSDDKIQKGRDIHPAHEEHPLSKLTEEQVAEIRRRYIPRIITQKQLAEEFGVDETNINLIVNRKSWR